MSTNQPQRTEPSTLDALTCCGRTFHPHCHGHGRTFAQNWTGAPLHPGGQTDLLEPRVYKRRESIELYYRYLKMIAECLSPLLIGC